MLGIGSVVSEALAILVALLRLVTDPKTGRIQNTNRNSTRKFSHSCPCYIFVQMRPSAQYRFVSISKHRIRKISPLKNSTRGVTTKYINT